MTTQDAASGAQREPDERVREALEHFDNPEKSDSLQDWSHGVTLRDELRRLQAAQREPVAEMLREARERLGHDIGCAVFDGPPRPCTCDVGPLLSRIDAALAASKGTPDSMGQGGLKDSGVSSQCHSSVADLKTCPFCHSHANVKRDGDWQWFVTCHTDRCPGNRDEATWSADTPEAAMADWNRRDNYPGGEDQRALDDIECGGES